MIRYIAILFLATTALAEPFEPQSGSPLRATILDAMRVEAERDLGAPIEFIVDDLRVDDDIAFASLTAQRPGGGIIDLSQAPMVLSGDRPHGTIDGPSVIGYLIRDGEDWNIADYIIGPTDVWWVGYNCARFASLQPPAACK